MLDKFALLKKLMKSSEPFNIMYVITGQCDGRWEIQAIDANYKFIGVAIVVSTPSEAWKLYMMLNGYSEETVHGPIDYKGVA